MAQFKPIKCTEAQMNSKAKSEGQLFFTTDTNKIYLDISNTSRMVLNANLATKATQDSSGQIINTTYIKGLSLSGQDLTYTKGNGTTGKITLPGGGTGSSDSSQFEEIFNRTTITKLSAYTGSFYPLYKTLTIDENNSYYAYITYRYEINTVSFFDSFFMLLNKDTYDTYFGVQMSRYLNNEVDISSGSSYPVALYFDFNNNNQNSSPYKISQIYIGNQHAKSTSSILNKINISNIHVYIKKI